MVLSAAALKADTTTTTTTTTTTQPSRGGGLQSNLPHTGGLLGQQHVQALGVEDIETIVMTEEGLYAAISSQNVKTIRVSGVVYVRWRLDLWKPREVTEYKHMLVNGTYKTVAITRKDPSSKIKRHVTITGGTLVFAPSVAVEASAEQANTYSRLANFSFVGVEAGATLTFTQTTVNNLLYLDDQGNVTMPIVSKAVGGVQLRNVRLVQTVDSAKQVIRFLKEAQYARDDVEGAYISTGAAVKPFNTTVVVDQKGTAQCCASKQLHYYHCRNLAVDHSSMSTLSCLERCCSLGPDVCDVWQYRVEPTNNTLRRSGDTRDLPFVPRGRCYLGKLGGNVDQMCYSSLFTKNATPPPSWYDSHLALITLVGEQLGAARPMCATFGMTMRIKAMVMEPGFTGKFMTDLTPSPPPQQQLPPPPPPPPPQPSLDTLLKSEPTAVLGANDRADYDPSILLLIVIALSIAACIIMVVRDRSKHAHIKMLSKKLARLSRHSAAGSPRHHHSNNNDDDDTGDDIEIAVASARPRAHRSRPVTAKRKWLPESLSTFLASLSRPLFARVESGRSNAGIISRNASSDISRNSSLDMDDNAIGRKPKNSHSETNLTSMANQEVEMVTPQLGQRHREWRKSEGQAGTVLDHSAAEAIFGQARSISQAAANAASTALGKNVVQSMNLMPDPVQLAQTLSWMSDVPNLPNAVGECLGRGVFGTVYHASFHESASPKNRNALKVIMYDVMNQELVDELWDDMTRDERLRWAARHETTVAERIQHQNILRTYICHKHLLKPRCEQVVFLQEYCDGGVLTDVLANGTFSSDCKTSVERALRCLDVSLQVMMGLDWLHQFGMLHGDVKASNVLLKTEFAGGGANSAEVSNVDEEKLDKCVLYRWRYAVKLADFGLSYELPKGKSSSVVGMRGTPTHLAPELFVPYDGVISPSSDMFAFGVFLWEVVMARAPYKNMSVKDVHEQRCVLNNRLSFDGKCENHMSVMQELAEMCWQNDPKARPWSAIALDMLKSSYENALREISELRSPS